MQKLLKFENIGEICQICNYVYVFYIYNPDFVNIKERQKTFIIVNVVLFCNYTITTEFIFFPFSLTIRIDTLSLVIFA